MKVPPLTIRRVMVAGIIAGSVIERERRRARFIGIATGHYKAYAQLLPAGPGRGDEPPRASYHHAMGEKYIEAARYPWLPVWPDPPEPASK